MTRYYDSETLTTIYNDVMSAGHVSFYCSSTASETITNSAVSGVSTGILIHNPLYNMAEGFIFNNANAKLICARFNRSNVEYVKYVDLTTVS